MTTKTIIFRNGRGGFVEGSEALRLGYECDGYNIFVEGFRHSPIEVVECTPEDLALPMDESKLFRTETGGIYKAVAEVTQ